MTYPIPAAMAVTTTMPITASQWFRSIDLTDGGRRGTGAGAGGGGPIAHGLGAMFIGRPSDRRGFPGIVAAPNRHFDSMTGGKTASPPHERHRIHSAQRYLISCPRGRSPTNAS